MNKLLLRMVNIIFERVTCSRFESENHHNLSSAGPNELHSYLRFVMCINRNSGTLIN